jgi:ABC-type transport system involved in cytochrome c biogenesis permease subunit
MATVSSPSAFANQPARAAANSTSWPMAILQVFGSLKLTVVLFSVALVLVFAGTLAQHHLNMLEVKERYFTSWVALMHFEDLVPYAFFPHETPLRGLIPIPGGALIGALLMINLVAAKITRFHVHASGARLYAGITAIVLGLLTTYLIVSSGQSDEGLQGEPRIGYNELWRIILGVMAASWVGIVGLAVTSNTLTARIAYLVLAIAIGGYIAFSLSTGYRIDDPGLRIVWQLAKGLGAGVILLVGCVLIFAKQGGNVLLHFGVGLLMVGQFLFGDRQLEQRLNLIEGQSANSFINLDEVELTFIRKEGDDQKVVGIPAELLVDSAANGTVIRDTKIPFDVRVKSFYKNSRLEPAKEKDNPANKGIGRNVAAVEARSSSGTESQVNLASAYVELLEKGTDKAVGSHLVSQWFSDREVFATGDSSTDEFDKVSADKQDYQLGLRFARTAKSFWVQLKDVRRVNYSGSDTPRDYRSFVRIVDPVSGEDRNEQIWMNNPLRYRGETYYQSNYTALPGGRESTGLQIVQNSGWLVPYVACSITALGLCVHFAGTLGTFVRRRSRENKKAVEAISATTGLPNDAPVGSVPGRKFGWPSVLVGGVACLAFMSLVPWSSVMNTLRPANRDADFDFHEFGKIPVQFGGRIMPLAAFANQTLTAISNKSSLPLEGAPAGIQERVEGRRLSSLQWLMEVAVDEERLSDLPMFRVDATEVRDEFGLEKRKSKLFTLNEIRSQIERFNQLTEAAGEKEPRDQSFKEKKLLELDRRIRAFTMVAVAFRLPIPHDLPADLFPEGTSEQERKMFALQQLERRMQAIEGMPAPAIVVPESSVAGVNEDTPKWSAFGPAFFQMAASSQSDAESRAGVTTFGEMIGAYRTEDPEKFNAAVDAHLAKVGAQAGTYYQPWKVALERWNESNWPTGVAMGLYMLALVISLIELIIQMPRLRSATWSILVIALVIHTTALVCRIVITGRAPVINIYSSAVFIGWAAVIAGLVQERIFRYGEGNLLASGSGLLALLVAYGLSSGDTMPVLQAVLDTQFWLGTHVISVTLGYAATMVAGLLGIRYLIAGWLGADSNSLRQIYRSIYGATCFGIVFSFVGTVLGGLWADDSWGRFWGWDPKENGALLIVIWNALMLHARWDGMAAARGFALLAIGGNIVTAWSYFGTNELGIGLHSYGFTSGVLMWLSVFIATQIFFIVLGVFLPAKTKFTEPLT